MEPPVFRCVFFLEIEASSFDEFTGSHNQKIQINEHYARKVPSCTREGVQR